MLLALIGPTSDYNIIAMNSVFQVDSCLSLYEQHRNSNVRYKRKLPKLSHLGVESELYVDAM